MHIHSVPYIGGVRVSTAKELRRGIIFELGLKVCRLEPQCVELRFCNRKQVRAMTVFALTTTSIAPGQEFLSKDHSFTRCSARVSWRGLQSCRARPVTRRYSCSQVLVKSGLSWMSSWDAWTHRRSLSRAWQRHPRSGSGYRGVVIASLFGVGAPEVLVIAVVALLVFGPKGLAEVARSLGQSLRAFQPTIRELQEVSRDFKQTLEKEIGLDELNPKNLGSKQQQASQLETSKPAVNENFVMEELTAQLNLLHEEKAKKETEGITDSKNAISAVATGDSIEEASKVPEEAIKVPEEASKVPEEAEPAKSSAKETSVNNVGAVGITKD